MSITRDGLITLLAAGTTSSAAPAFNAAITVGTAMPFSADQCLIMLRSTAGSNVMDADIRLWGYNHLSSQWYSLGKLNNGVAIPECATDRLSHAEIVVGLRKIGALYAEIVSLGGTGTAVEILAQPIPAETSSR